MIRSCVFVTCAALGAIPGAAQAQVSPQAPAAQAASKAKAAGQVIEAANDAAVEGCRDLGEADQYTSTPGARGQIDMREALKTTGRIRGASHIRYSGHVTLIDDGAQREHAHFYDCTTPPAPPATDPADDASASVMAALSGQLELVPVGTLHSKVDMQSIEADAATAFGVSANVEAILPPYFAIGINPGLVLGLKSGGAMASATQLDLRARMRLGHVAAEGFGEYGYVTAGGSWILTPNDGDTSAGFSLGVGAGVTRRVDRLSFVTFELGFQAGFQNMTVHDTSIELSSRLFHIGLGFGRYLP